MKNKSLKHTLNQLLKILQLEKEALIQNEAAKIENLVSEKEALVEAFEDYDLEEINQEDQELISLIGEIREKQETNLLLTKQAMNYADKFISAFQKEASKDLTYSKEGKDHNSGKSSILNQSL